MILYISRYVLIQEFWKQHWSHTNVQWLIFAVKVAIFRILVDISLGISRRVLLERFNWRRNTYNYHGRNEDISLTFVLLVRVCRKMKPKILGCPPSPEKLYAWRRKNSEVQWQPEEKLKVFSFSFDKFSNHQFRREWRLHNKHIQYHTLVRTAHLCISLTFNLNLNATSHPQRQTYGWLNLFIYLLYFPM